MAARKEVRIRMYRQGLGDCFLLSFPRKGSRTKRVHVLIDCGALISAYATPQLMKEVVRDIHTTTGGHLDVVVATHEHWDHVSGFIHAKEVFQEFTVGQVWVAWTEDPDSEAAKRLKEEFKKQKVAVERALARLPSPREHPQLGLYRNAITELFGFFGGLAAAGGGTDDAWENILKLGPKAYCDPAQAPRSLDGAPGVRVFVLGPPEDPDYIRKQVSKVETYHEDGGHGMTFADSFLAAVAPDGQDASLKARAFPFDERHRMGVAEAHGKDFFKNFYLADEWRRIEYDWLTVAGELALHLDSYTNNTCLALAIELGASGKVLLFPGDAQVGNWLSWGERSWEVNDGDGNVRTVRVDDLLGRTVFYKVGHHGSHNATLRARGLEKMASPELVAMIPVHRPTAEQQEWKFPYPPLWQRLKEKTRGRVLLADVDDIQVLKPDTEGRLSASEWKQFKAATRHQRLYVQYRVRY